MSKLNLMKHFTEGNLWRVTTRIHHLSSLPFDVIYPSPYPRRSRLLVLCQLRIFREVVRIRYGSVHVQSLTKVGQHLVDVDDCDLSINVKIHWHLKGLIQAFVPQRCLSSE